MELRLDVSKPYALALEGGGAKGGYQIGAWRALREAGVNISAVAGTSVGALNGALIAMDDYQKAYDAWNTIRFSQVIDVDDDMMHQLFYGKISVQWLKAASEQLKQTVKNRGFDVSPLYEWLRRLVDEDAIRASDRELFIVTVSLTDRKELELRAKDLAPGTLVDMLLASAYLPVFKNEPLGGKRYTDGGIADAIPMHVLVKNGYTDIIAIRLYGYGVTRRVRIPAGTDVHMVAPLEDLGGVLEFEPERSRRNMALGYYDMQRMLYGLKGTGWYFDSAWDEKRAYDYLMDQVTDYIRQKGETMTLRAVNEKLLPSLARNLDVRTGDYTDLAVALLEAGAEKAGAEHFRIYSEDEMAALVGRCPVSDILG